MPTIATSEAPSYMVQRSTWHSPVPYLFGGLAAMLGLIAFALLILACSYWKLSGQINDAERDLEAGDADGEKPVLEEKYLVIMAGQVNPTFLATPMSSRASSFGSVKTSNSSSCCSSSSSTTSCESSTLKENNNGQVEMGDLQAHQDLESPVH